MVLWKRGDAETEIESYCHFIKLQTISSKFVTPRKAGEETHVATRDWCYGLAGNSVFSVV